MKSVFTIFPIILFLAIQSQPNCFCDDISKSTSINSKLFAEKDQTRLLIKTTMDNLVKKYNAVAKTDPNQQYPFLKNLSFSSKKSLRKNFAAKNRESKITNKNAMETVIRESMVLGINSNQNKFKIDFLYLYIDPIEFDCKKNFGLHFTNQKRNQDKSTLENKGELVLRESAKDYKNRPVSPLHATGVNIFENHVFNHYHSGEFEYDTCIHFCIFLNKILRAYFQTEIYKVTNLDSPIGHLFHQKNNNCQNKGIGIDRFMTRSELSSTSFNDSPLENHLINKPGFIVQELPTTTFENNSADFKDIFEDQISKLNEHPENKEYEYLAGKSDEVETKIVTNPILNKLIQKVEEAIPRNNRFENLETGQRTGRNSHSENKREIEENHKKTKPKKSKTKSNKYIEIKNKSQKTTEEVKMEKSQLEDYFKHLKRGPRPPLRIDSVDLRKNQMERNQEMFVNENKDHRNQSQEDLVDLQEQVNKQKNLIKKELEKEQKEIQNKNNLKNKQTNFPKKYEDVVPFKNLKFKPEEKVDRPKNQFLKQNNPAQFKEMTDKLPENVISLNNLIEKMHVREPNKKLKTKNHETFGLTDLRIKKFMDFKIAEQKHFTNISPDVEKKENLFLNVLVSEVEQKLFLERTKLVFKGQTRNIKEILTDYKKIIEAGIFTDKNTGKSVYFENGSKEKEFFALEHPGNPLFFEINTPKESQIIDFETKKRFIDGIIQTLDELNDTSDENKALLGIPEKTGYQIFNDMTIHVSPYSVLQNVLLVHLVYNEYELVKIMEMSSYIDNIKAKIWVRFEYFSDTKTLHGVVYKKQNVQFLSNQSKIDLVETAVQKWKQENKEKDVQIRNLEQIFYTLEIKK